MDKALEKITELVKKPRVLLAAGLAGILLICLPSLFGRDGEKTEPAKSTEMSVEEYRAALETAVERLVSGITGSERVEAVVTLESGPVYSYADVTEGTAADKTDNNTTSTSSELKKSYITVKTADGGEQALLVTTEMPQVRGVAVVCEGGDDKALCEKITGAVTAALNITSKRVYIAGGSYNEKR